MAKRAKINSTSFFVGRGGNDGIISFGSGQPDLPPPKEVYEILPTYRAFKYGLIQGQENLRSALAGQYSGNPRTKRAEQLRRTQWSNPRQGDEASDEASHDGADPENFVITNGASEALDLIFRVIERRSKKKKVLLAKPYYYSYPFTVRFSGLEPVFTELNEEGRIDINDFNKKIKQCCAVLINSPSNPTGRIESVATLKEIERVTKKFGVYVISDEVYKDLIYERENYLIKGKNVVTINSFSKTFGMCGFRVGYLYSPDKKLVRDVVEMKVHTSMNTNILGQEMAYEATKVPRAYIHKQTLIWKERRDLLYGGLRELGFQLWKPEGAFYVFPKIKNSNRVVNELFYDYKVIVYDGAWFGGPDHIRLSYALDADKIKEGLARIKEYLKGKEKWLA